MSEQDQTPQEGGEEQEQEIQLSPAEQEALAQGWVPKDEFNGDEHKWVDAGEFLRRGELFKKIEDQGRKLKDVTKALEDMKKHHASVREVEYKRALETLRAQKKAALEEGDADAVIAADERIDLVKEEQRQLEVQVQNEPAPQEEHPMFVDWKSKNPWYTTQDHMKVFADKVGMKFRSQGMSPAEVLTQVEKAVRNEFPNKFTNPNQQRSSGVEAPSGRAGKSDSFKLTDEERTMMNRFVRTGALTEKEYIADLKRAKGIQ